MLRIKENPSIPWLKEKPSLLKLKETAKQKSQSFEYYNITAYPKSIAKLISYQNNYVKVLINGFSNR